MISASSALYNYFNQNIREEGQEIEIKISKSGRTYTITDDDLVASSVKITKKSVSGASFDIGECYVDSATFTINKNINNYKSLTGAKVTITISVNNEDLNLDESVLLGTFRILQDGIKRTNTLLQVTADSYISKFDKSRKRATFTGDLYDLIKDSCSKCRVTFGMSESAFRALSANVAKTYEIKKDSSLKTYRDVVMYVAQLIGGFATTTPEGALIFKNYTSNNDICNVNDNVIVNYSIGDEVYNLSGLGMSVKENDVYLYREGEDDDSPYFLNLDSNPIIENCTDEEITAIVGNIWNKLIELNLNNFSFEFNGNPLIEVGDIISIPERSLETYVASCEWTYHGKESISCVRVDKNKRIETQREKKNENKASKASKDDRVDELIKKTTTGTKIIKKTHTNRYDIVRSSSGRDLTGHLPEYYWSEPQGTGSGRADLRFKVSLISPLLEENFFYNTIISRFPIKPANDDIITVDLSNLMNYIIIGYLKDNGYCDIDASASLSFKPKPNDDTYVSNNVINASTLKSKIYKLNALYGVIDELPDFYFSSKATLSSTDKNTDTEIISKSNLSLNIKINLENLQNLYTYESFENGILKVKYKDLLNYDGIASNFFANSNNAESFNGYSRKIKYVSKQLRDDTITNFATGQLVTLNSAIATIKSNLQEEINAIPETFSITVSYDTYENESYNVTIEGTSEKINDTDKKAEDNKSEIEKLNTAVSNLKASVKTNTARIKSLITRVGIHDNTISETREETARLDQRVKKLENSSSCSGGGMTDEQKQQLEQNTKDISTLKTNVSNNSTHINTNSTNISNLTTRVTNLEKGGDSSGGSGITEEEKQQIQTNKTDIANLKTRVTNLENSGGSGGSGSGITEEEKQQIQTNKTNIENLTLIVNGHTTSIEDILKRLAVLEQGGGGDTGESLKFTSFDIKFNKDKSLSSQYFPNFDITNYKIDDTYYLTETNNNQLYYYLVAILNKTGSSQTFRQRSEVDSSDFTIIDEKTLNVQSSDIQFIHANRDFYYDCESSLNDLYARSKSIHIKTYSWVRATRDANWINETTGNKPTSGAHSGDIINLKTEFSGGFKALNLANAPSALNRYYYKIIFTNGSTNNPADSSASIVADWTPLNAEPDVLTDIRFTFNSSWGGKTVNLFISDGQYVVRADYDKIPLLT